MNLKEVFRYQNKLQSFPDDVQSILDCNSNVTQVENTYLRHKVMAETEDKTVLAVSETEYYEQIMDIVRFLLYLLDEKGKLFAAIRKTKSELDIIKGLPACRCARCSNSVLVFRHPRYDSNGTYQNVPLLRLSKQPYASVR